ncbi:MULTISPECIES: polyprenyl synthetase family protein [unclassified Janibacter]|uniref:polyprenyl synthetase family protein n=1 Tax=unclassified Janibacter TaxID=2649294 RepID=UPI003CFD0F42
MSDPLSAAGLRARVQECIDAELATQGDVLAELGPDVDDLLAAIRTLLSGGKRLRAAFLYWGLRAAGRPDSDGAIRLATSMEFFQAAALLHDDVMDDSDTRRGAPAAHRSLATDHQRRAWTGDADRFGAAGAILAGNLCLTWTDELYATAGLPDADLARGRALFDRMRSQLMAGQFLDVVESVRPWDALDSAERLTRARRVIHYKSAKYSIEHPLLIGALVGGLANEPLAALSRYGLALGEAFQLRDDLLGVFGDPATTGKPAGDDLREGKRTVLVAHTLDGADERGRDLLARRLGSPDLTPQDVADLRQVITDSGAVSAIEAEITALTATAHEALAAAEGDLEPEAAKVLADLVDVTTARAT